MAKEPTQQELSDFVRREVHHCVSSLVSTLAQAFGSTMPDNGAGDDLAELCEKAAELSYPVEDWQEAAEQTGVEIRKNGVMLQYSSKSSRAAAAAWSPGEGETESDRPDAWVDLDTTDEDDAWREACGLEMIDPYEWEIYEHWIVSSWLAGKLEAKGHRVDRDFANLIVWGRPTTGQAISLDSVIAEIWRDSHPDNGDHT